MKKLLLLLIFSECLSFLAKAQNDTVLFSASGGFYEEVLQLELFNYNPQYHIRYTTNDSRPTAQSSLYEGALVLEPIYIQNQTFTLLSIVLSKVSTYLTRYSIAS